LSELSSENLQDELLRRLPELTEPSHEVFSYFGDERPGDHVFVGDLLNPFLVEQLKTQDDPEVLSRAFGFIEEMATSRDESVVNVAQVTVLEYLGKERRILEAAIRHMGPETRKLSAQLEAFWNGKPPDAR